MSDDKNSLQNGRVIRRDQVGQQPPKVSQKDRPNPPAKKQISK